MRKLILTALTGLLFVSSVFALGVRSSPPKFTSVYTDLSRHCKAALKSVGEGQDMPLNCKGYGGYRIAVGYSAMYAHVAAETLNGKHIIPLTTAQVNYDLEKGRKIEWRLANGRPFAVILRVEDKLLVKGLVGNETIDYDIDAKTPNANQQARDMADKGFTK